MSLYRLACLFSRFIAARYVSWYHGMPITGRYFSHVAVTLINFAGCKSVKMLLLTLAILSVAVGDSTLECKPTGFCECVVSGLSSGLAEIDLRPIFEDGPLEM